MSASEYSKYLQFDITSADGEKTVDISPGVSEFRFYEDIFSPVMTAKIVVMDSGKNRINGDKFNEPLYSGLPIQGYESFKIKIENQRKQILNLNDLKCFLPSGLITKNNNEFFSLNLISKDYFTDSTSRVQRKLPAVASNQNVESILKRELQTDKQYFSNPSTSKFSYQGNNRKPFTVIMNIAGRSVGDKPDKSSGFLFYETRRGYNFFSTDYLSSQPSAEEYFYTNVMRTQYDPQGFDLNRKILSYSEEQTKDLIKVIQYGGYGSKRYVINPYTTSTIDKPIEFKIDDSSFAINTLGKSAWKAPEELTEKQSRLFSAVLDLENNPSEVNIDYSQFLSQSPFRYNVLFSQVINITIPSNFDLHAGDVISVNIPKVGCNYEYDDVISGKYLIKELCHYISAQQSYTYLRLIRDTNGRKTQ